MNIHKICCEKKKRRYQISLQDGDCVQDYIHIVILITKQPDHVQHYIRIG